MIKRAKKTSGAPAFSNDDVISFDKHIPSLNSYEFIEWSADRIYEANERGGSVELYDATVGDRGFYASDYLRAACGFGTHDYGRNKNIQRGDIETVLDSVYEYIYKNQWEEVNYDGQDMSEMIEELNLDEFGDDEERIREAMHEVAQDIFRNLEDRGLIEIYSHRPNIYKSGVPFCVVMKYNFRELERGLNNKNALAQMKKELNKLGDRYGSNEMPSEMALYITLLPKDAIAIDENLRKEGTFSFKNAKIVFDMNVDGFFADGTLPLSLIDEIYPFACGFAEDEDDDSYGDLTKLDVAKSRKERYTPNIYMHGRRMERGRHR